MPCSCFLIADAGSATWHVASSRGGYGGSCQSRRVFLISRWVRSGPGTEPSVSSGKARYGTPPLVRRNEDLQGHVRQGRGLGGRGRDLCPPLDGRLRCLHPWPEHVRCDTWGMAGRQMEGLVGRQ